MIQVPPPPPSKGALLSPDGLAHGAVVEVQASLPAVPVRPEERPQHAQHRSPLVSRQTALLAASIGLFRALLLLCHTNEQVRGHWCLHHKSHTQP